MGVLSDFIRTVRTNFLKFGNLYAVVLYCLQLWKVSNQGSNLGQIGVIGNIL